MLWIILGVVAAVLIYKKLSAYHQFWATRNVKQERNPSFVLGDNLGTFFKTSSFADMVTTVYKRFSSERYSGAYQFLMPMLILRDPEIIKQITVKDFDHFVDHRSFLPDGADELWSKNLFALTGEKWRDMRATLSPSFTSSKMKSMFVLISECAEQFTQYFADKTEQKIEVEMKDTFTRYANDVIATCAFGVKCDSLKERDNMFYVMGKDATDFSGFWKSLSFFMYLIVPQICKALGFKIFSNQVAAFFKGLVKDTIKTREEQNIVRPDMIHLLMEARKGRLQYVEDKTTEKQTGFATVEESVIGKVVAESNLQKNEITDLDITAQALIFFFAGFETISTMMCFMAYELAINEDVQDRLIQEIDEHLVETNGVVSYEGINKLKYLDMVVTETLRKWPPAVAVDRVCTKPYTIAPTIPSEQPVALETGTIIWLPIFGIHRDPIYYPHPERFDPERFNDANRDKIHQYAYLPFGAGPRNCIGSRFALMEAKTVFVHMLKKFKFSPIARTDIPFKISRKSFNLNSANGFWLGMEKRS